jgi:hypothetical protein
MTNRIDEQTANLRDCFSTGEGVVIDFLTETFDAVRAGIVTEKEATRRLDSIRSEGFSLYGVRFDKPVEGCDGFETDLVLIPNGELMYKWSAHLGGRVKAVIEKTTTPFAKPVICALEAA